MSSIRRALALSFVERYLLLVVALVSNLLLARLLTPEQIGVFSVSLAVIGVAQALRDFGVGNYLIQERELTPQKIAAAFTLSIAIGAALFILIELFAPFLAAFYNQPRMAVTLRIAAFNFVFMPVGTVCLSLLRREMRFQRVLAANLISTLLGAAISIWLAMTGYGENSLALGSVISQGVAAGIAWWQIRHRHVLQLRFSHLGEVARFGGMSSASGLITSVSMDANDIVVGKLLGFQQVAMLSRAQGLSYLVHRDLLGAVRNVALPALAQARREGADVGSQFMRGVANMTLLAWVLYGWIGIYSLEAVSLLYGDQWLSAVPLVPIFCIAGAAGALNVITPNLLMAVGAMRTMMWVDLFLQPTRLVLIGTGALYFGSIYACAWGFLGAALISLPVFRYARARHVAISTAEEFHLLMINIFIATLTLLPAILHAYWAGFGRSTPAPLWSIAASVCLGSVLGFWLLMRLNHPLAREEVVARLRSRFSAQP